MTLGEVWNVKVRRRERHGCELFPDAGGRDLCCFSGAVNSRSERRQASREQ